MFIVLVAIGSVDLLFALDSMAAVFGVTDHAHAVFAANAFALLGLRALDLLVTGLLDGLVSLSFERAVELAAFVSSEPGPGGTPLYEWIDIREVMS